jgi:hypothetical protein
MFLDYYVAMYLRLSGPGLFLGDTDLDKLVHCIFVRSLGLEATLDC